MCSRYPLNPTGTLSLKRKPLHSSEYIAASSLKKQRAHSSPGCAPSAVGGTRSIQKPHPHDVLCAGLVSPRHFGNIAFTRLVEFNIATFQALSKESHKGLLARSIVEAIQQQTPPGRFLFSEDASISGIWYDKGKDFAIQQTLHVLRQGAEDENDEQVGKQDKE